MRKVVVSTNVALDGVMEAPDSWFFGFWSDELAKSAHEELLQSDVLLLGRVTCEAFAEFWPTATNEPSIAERMNGLPKHVASTTLEEPLEWSNSTLIKGDVAEEVDGLEGARHPGAYGPAHHRGGTLDAVRRVLGRHPRQRRQYRVPEPPVPAVGVRRKASGAARGEILFRDQCRQRDGSPSPELRSGGPGAGRRLLRRVRGGRAPERGQRVGQGSGGLRLSSAPERRGLFPDGKHAEERAAKLDYPLYTIDDESAIEVVAGLAEVVPEGEWRLFDR